jgi:uncharacterized HAD superfamily protein
MMKDRKLGIDLDGVIAEIGTPLGKKLGVPKDHINEYELSSYGVASEDLPNILDYDFYMSLEPEKNCVEVMGWLKKRDNYLHIITARNKYIDSEHTLEWLKAHKIPFHRFTQVTGSNDKIPIVKSEGLDYLIDDRFETCQEFAKRRLRTILFEQPWNYYHMRTTTREYQYIIRAVNWEYIKEFIRR